MRLVQIFEEFGQKENGFVVKVERDNTVSAKKFPNSEYLNFFIRIYLDLDQNLSPDNRYAFDDISFVIYELPNSYKESRRMARDFTNKFEVKLWAPGYFKIVAIIYPKYG